MPTESIETQASGKLVRLIRPSVVVLCGPAACGKSTFAERHFRPTQIISSDWARGRVCDDDRDQRFNSQAFALVHFLVEQRLSLNRLCVVDSTALTSSARQELLGLAKRRQVPAVALVFEVPLDLCLERDQKRERSVGRAVIERQFQAYDQTRAAIRQEGFDQILEFRDGETDNVRVEIVFRPVARPPLHVPRPESQHRHAERPVFAPGGGSPLPAQQTLRSGAPRPAPDRPATAPPSPASGVGKLGTAGPSPANSPAAPQIAAQQPAAPPPEKKD